MNRGHCRSARLSLARRTIAVIVAWSCSRAGRMVTCIRPVWFSGPTARYAAWMGRTKNTLLVIAGTAAGVTAAKQTVARRRRRGEDRDSHVITVYRPIGEIHVNGKLPSPLTELGDKVDVELRPAPGDRGTEISVRPRDGGVSAGVVRRALRDSRSLLETGDVLLP